mmetsp:Transcript_135508/g.238937  ORF Transcript_135508/g.238937 Transcript_135508/m.238937 type:complete len:149 (+) Transcript_135508:2006-2452(+)
MLDLATAKVLQVPAGHLRLMPVVQQVGVAHPPVGLRWMARAKEKAKTTDLLEPKGVGEEKVVMIGAAAGTVKEDQPWVPGVAAEGTPGGARVGQARETVAMEAKAAKAMIAGQVVGAQDAEKEMLQKAAKAMALGTVAGVQAMAKAVQ